MVGRKRATEKAAVDLPSVYRLVTLRESGDAFAHAMAIGAEAGAGTLVWVRRFDVVELAVVLEPDEPLASARRTLYAGMTAAVDALAAWCPPEKPIAIDWPDAILFDGAVVGGGRLGWPAEAEETAPPPFLVFGLMLRTAVHGRLEDQNFARGTTLEAEGFDLIDAVALVESFARHLMVAVHEWEDRGFAALAERYLARLPRRVGERRGLDGEGALVVHKASAPDPTPEHHALVPRLAAPAWLDPTTGMPWL